MQAQALRSRARLARGILDQYVFHLAIGEIPRVIFGNDAGFMNNVRATRELSELRKSRTVPAPADPRAQALTRDGYVVFKPSYEPGLIDTIRRKFEEQIVDRAFSRPIGPRLQTAITALEEPIVSVPEIAKLLTPEVSAVIVSHYSSEFRVVNVRSWRNVSVSGDWANKDVFSNLWHHDHDPVTLLRYFVLLSDGVTRQTGATRLHTIANTKRIMRSGYLRRRLIVGPAKTLVDDPTRVAYFEGDAGTASLVNPQLSLHGAGVPKQGTHRDIVQFTLAPAAQPLGPNWMRELPPDHAGVG
jgi:hypothetical protein